MIFKIIIKPNCDYSNITMIIREKGRDLTQSYDKSSYTYRKIQKATLQHKNVDYILIAGRFRTDS